MHMLHKSAGALAAFLRLYHDVKATWKSIKNRFWHTSCNDFPLGNTILYKICNPVPGRPFYNTDPIR